jgi:hypothetical protein
VENRGLYRQLPASLTSPRGLLCSPRVLLCSPRVLLCSPRVLLCRHMERCMGTATSMSANENGGSENQHVVLVSAKSVSRHVVWKRRTKLLRNECLCQAAEWSNGKVLDLWSQLTGPIYSYCPNDFGQITLISLPSIYSRARNTSHSGGNALTNVHPLNGNQNYGAYWCLQTLTSTERIIYRYIIWDRSLIHLHVARETPSCIDIN